MGYHRCRTAASFEDIHPYKHYFRPNTGSAVIYGLSGISGMSNSKFNHLQIQGKSLGTLNAKCGKIISEDVYSYNPTQN